jgi:hypothetical protein
LQNNQLTGAVPAGLADLSIAEFDVCGNQLDPYPEECPGPSSMSPTDDTDNDGVPDYMDICPLEGGFVHADGCPVDSDNDGVRVRIIAAFELISHFASSTISLMAPLAYLSFSLFPPLLKTKDCVSTNEDAQCHSTTEITTISDLDSCCNVERDYCPNDTPRGATVYTEAKTIGDVTIEPGCKSDTDKDGIYDGLDRCPDTTAEDLEMIAASDTMFLDEQGCVVLSPQMWEATFIEEATVVSKIDGMPHLDLLFTVNKGLSELATARSYPELVQSQVMDASCINTFDDLTDTSTKQLSSVVAMNEQRSYTGDIPTDAVPVMVGLDFDISKLIGSTVWTDEPNGIARIDFCLKLSVMSYADALGAFSFDFGTCMHFEQLYFDSIISQDTCYPLHIPFFIFVGFRC